MKTKIKSLVPMIFIAALFIGGCAKKQSASSWSLDKSGASAQLKQFIAAQEIQSRALAKQDGIKLPAEFDAFSRPPKRATGRMRPTFSAR